MRVTENTTANVVFNNLQVNRQRTEMLQQQASTGVKVSFPGDDPIAAEQILGLKDHMQARNQYERNLNIGDAWLRQSEAAMAEMGNILSRTKEIAIGMSNGTYNATARASMVNELKQLKNQLVQLGNSQIAGKYVFGGFVNDRPPFDTTIINTPPLKDTVVGAFNGTDDDVKMDVDEGAYIPINYSGGKLLRGNPANIPLTGNTTLGSNTISGIASTTNLIQGMAVTGPGIPPNTLITSILGPNSITVSNNATATGAAVAMTNSTGVDMVGTFDKLISDMSSNNVAGIQDSLPILDNSINQVLMARGDVGARMNRMDSAASVLQDLKYNLSSVLSDKQDVDMMKIMSDLTRQQTAFQATLSASAKISQISLLDYLR